jgi:hypothetical protein
MGDGIEDMNHERMEVLMRAKQWEDVHEIVYDDSMEIVDFGWGTIVVEYDTMGNRTIDNLVWPDPDDASIPMPTFEEVCATAAAASSGRGASSSKRRRGAKDATQREFRLNVRAFEPGAAADAVGLLYLSEGHSFKHDGYAHRRVIDTLSTTRGNVGFKQSRTGRPYSPF